MKTLQLFSMSVTATLALGLLTHVHAADRLQSAAQTATNAAKTFRCAGTVVDADGKPVAGAVVECYQYGSGGRPFSAPDMEAKQRVTTGTDGAFALQISPGSTVAARAKARSRARVDLNTGIRPRT